METHTHLALITGALRVKNKYGFPHDMESIPPIDEVALCFPTEAMLDEWLVLVDYDPLLTHYRSERDRMVRMDKEEWFDVRFEFVTVSIGEKEHPWRIEAMVVLEGEAPLHDALLKLTKGSPGIIHASYKLDTEDEYDIEMEALETELGMRRMATYRNDYGRFSYWRPGSFPVGPGVHLKPRVNLRDS